MGAIRADDVESIEAGVDWLTWVVPRTKETQWVGEMGRRLVRQQCERGAKLSVMRLEGYTGEQAEQCAYGSRSDSEYLRLSGSLAASHWCELRSSSGHPTRLDVQTTFKLKTSHKSFGTQCLKVNPAAGFRFRGRPPKRALHRDSAALWCGTVGTRTARAYLRVYDKGVESGSDAPGVRWRIESEVKGTLARQAFAELVADGDPPGWCVTWCKRAIRNVGSRWPIPGNDEVAPLPPVPPRDLASIERTRKWLETSVAPCIDRMVIALGTQAVLQALTLDRYAEAFTRTATGEE